MSKTFCKSKVNVNKMQGEKNKTKDDFILQCKCTERQIVFSIQIKTRTTTLNIILVEL